MKKYNHAFEICFSLNSDNEGNKVTNEELRIGLLKRIADIEEEGGDYIEACDNSYDSYENEQGGDDANVDVRS